MNYKTQLDINLLFYNLPIYNKPITWFLAPILARSAKLKQRNDRIMAMVNKAFPELA